jgi:hypothetical protein
MDGPAGFRGPLEPSLHLTCTRRVLVTAQSFASAVLKSTTKVQPTLLLSQRRAKKIIWGRGKNGLAKKNNWTVFLLKTYQKRRAAARRRKNSLFFEGKNARAAREEKSGSVVNILGP